MGKNYHIQVDSKNAILELLKADKSFEKIYVATNAFKDPKTLAILTEARKRDIPVIKVARRSIDRKSRGRGTKSILGLLISENSWALDDLLNHLFSQKKNPFFLILDNPKYAQNIGAIFRVAYASGVNGIVLPVKQNSYIDSEVTRVSMGASERVPIVEMGVFECMKDLKKNGVKILALHNDGEVYYEQDLKGPLALVIGSEDESISSKVLERVDGTISIPMREGVGELNVAVGTGVLCYEKLRQEVN
jgi:23S rRNA (guanosine2251-2'-O)-methyltransferase